MNNLSFSSLDIPKMLAAHAAKKPVRPPREASVLLPLLEKEDGLHILYELRSSALRHQPGEVSFPGGAMEPGETPEEAALRETSEELLISEDQITLLGPLSVFQSAVGTRVHAFVGRIDGYEGTFSAAETERVFTIPVSWLLTHPAVHYPGARVASPTTDDFPYDLIPNGRNYSWGRTTYTIPVYHGTDPVLWGLTARLTDEFIRITAAALSRENKHD